jgi:uncharacterized protein (TIGR03437 family)
MPTLSFDAPVLFAGLAPGMIGIYQVTVRMPNTSGVDPGQHNASLRLQSGSGSAYANFTLTTQ